MHTAWLDWSQSKKAFNESDNSFPRKFNFVGVIFEEISFQFDDKKVRDRPSLLLPVYGWKVGSEHKRSSICHGGKSCKQE